MNTTMVRAYMCRQLGAAMRQRNVDQFFTVGLLSLIDAVVDRPMTEVLKLLPLVDDVKNAIVHRTGPMGAVLNCVEAYEQCDWDRASCKGVDDREIRQAYLNSVTRSRATTEKVVA